MTLRVGEQGIFQDCSLRSCMRAECGTDNEGGQLAEYKWVARAAE